MLVLCAAYNSWLGPRVANLVDRGRLIELLDRTIELLHKLAPLSRVMSVNERVLITAREDVIRTEDTHPVSGRGIPSAHSSFGST